MRSQPQSSFRPLFFPNGLLIVSTLLALYFVPSLKGYEQSIRLMCFVFLTATALLAFRLHSLRAFLASLSLTAFFLFVRLGTADRVFIKCATVLIAVNFVLLLLVEDVFFDWQAVMWWTGLLLIQWITFMGLAQWAPTMLKDFAGTRLDLIALHVGLLEFAVTMIIVVLLLKFSYSPDAVGAGAILAVASLFPIFETADIPEAYIAVAGIAIGISVIERSHWIAYHDELTGLPGRRAFNEALAGLGEQFSIGIVDVDHFKNFNDTFGHDTGDQVLRKVAANLSRVAGGTAYRCGGEEFAIVFREIESEEAKFYADDLRRAIEADSFVARGPARSTRKRDERRASQTRRKQPAATRTAVTVSIGLADSAAGKLLAQEVVMAADKALYEAKRLGRNQVVCASTRKLRIRAKVVEEATPASIRK